MQINLNQSASSQIELDKSTSTAGSAVSQNSASTQNASASSASVVDSTSLTSQSSTVSALQQQALAAPDVRQDKVAALKEQMQSGSYDYSPASTAKAMIENGF